MANEVMNTKRGKTLITQDALLPGIIKERHLVPGSGANQGDLVYSNNSGGFTNLKAGSTGQTLVVIGGVPTWQTFPGIGIATARPTAGRFAGDQFYATDTKVLSLWDGAAWRTTTLA